MNTSTEEISRNFIVDIPMNQKIFVLKQEHVLLSTIVGDEASKFYPKDHRELSTWVANLSRILIMKHII